MGDMGHLSICSCFFFMKMIHECFGNFGYSMYIEIQRTLDKGQAVFDYSTLVHIIFRKDCMYLSLTVLWLY